MTKAQRLRANLGAWHLALNPTVKPAPFHHEKLIPALERLEQRQGKHKLAVFVPPGHGKTSVGTYSFCSWYMGRNPGHNVMTLSYADLLAKDFGRKLRDICRNPDALKIFPKLELKQGSKSIQQFATIGENTYFASGFDGTLAGRRLDLLDIDDPVKSLAEAHSPSTMQSRFDIYRSVVGARLKPNGIVLMNLTRYDMGDFADMVLKYERDEWEVLELSAENTDGTFLWEEYFGRDRYLREKKKDPMVWWATWMQQPQNFHNHFFTEDHLNFYEPGSIPKTWATYMICDPALTQKRKSDRTSILVIAAGPERRLFVVDWVYDRMDPGQRADAIVRLLRRWKPRRFIYEEFGLVSDTFYLNERLAKEHIACRPIPVGKRGPRAQLHKEDRIRELISDFTAARIWFPEKLMQKCADGTTIDVIKTFIEEEFLPYRGDNSVAHDDGLDSLSRIHEPELRIEYLAPLDTERTRETRRGTWEAYF